MLDQVLLENPPRRSNTASRYRYDLQYATQMRQSGHAAASKVSRLYGDVGLPETTPFNAPSPAAPGRVRPHFLAKGITLRLIGNSNDYLGEGLSGGRLIVRAA